MDNPRKARVVEQHFLNLPGFHAGAYVRAYVQDTSDEEVRPPGERVAGQAPTPRLELEIADCFRHINLDFSIYDVEDRLNSFHKIEVLIGALVAFKEGMAEEAALRRRRLRELKSEAPGQSPQTKSASPIARPPQDGVACVSGT